jgi:hypothetical protein
MRRIVGSPGYARARLVTGTVAMVLGLILIVRMAMSVGLQLSGIPAYVLGLAMILLGVFRYYEYGVARRNT